jgi:hypothetical protein
MDASLDVAADRTATVAQAVARMRAIVDGGPSRDGVVCFSRLYLAVTEGVEARLAGRTFADPRFLSRLDVVFADRFFAAVDAAPAAVPPAWAPLFEQRGRPGIAPLQFALAGMNAHMNRDLPVALVTTCEELDVELADDSPQHADFEQVNQCLAAVEETIKKQYLSGWLGELDHIVHGFDRLDDVVAMWDVRRARDAAWTNARALWALRGNPDLSAQFLQALDRMVGFAGRGLLVPAEPAVRTIARRLHLF